MKVCYDDNMVHEKSPAEYEVELLRLRSHIINRENLDVFKAQAIANLYADDCISSGKFRELMRDWLTNPDFTITIPNEKEYIRSINYDTEQIFFKSWYDPKAPKEYFSTIDRIAYVIGLMLAENSTITIEQTKEKFGEPRIYVSIASLEKVNERWQKLGNAGDVDDEFIDAARISDIKHYNHCYRVAYELFPQYRKAISAGADFTEWTFSSTYEWDMWCDWQSRYSPNYRDDSKEIYDLLYAPLKKFEAK